jgi:hypothetical protein
MGISNLNKLNIILDEADESNETKPSTELSSAESNPSRAAEGIFLINFISYFPINIEGFQCYIQRGMDPVLCPFPYWFGGIDCSNLTGTPHFHFIGKKLFRSNF